MRGFSLLEILIALSILALLASSASWYAIDAFLRSESRASIQCILVSLFEARAEALHSVCSEPHCLSAVPHGIYVQPSFVTIFEGNSYADRYTLADQTFSINGIKNIEGISEIIFAPSTGTVATSTEFLVHTFIGTTTFSISEDGQVSEFP